MSMKHFITLIVLILIVIGAIFVANRRVEAPETIPEDTLNETQTMTDTNTTLTLTSSAFKGGERIPSRYTCDGANVNPQLSWSGVPEGAQSLVLLMDDPDIPQEVKSSRGINVFDHWVVFNMLADTTEIAEGSTPPGIEGQNSSGEVGYTGPCPPSQYEPTEHRYFFKLFALDAELDLKESATKEEVEEAMKDHALAEAVLIGKYERQ